MIKVSIIVPVYNVEKYLEKCLDSIINQSLKEIEIICVNDCSLDKSLDILKKYKSVDDRVIIINNETNQRAGYSRNIGVERASGEYIGFIDSDDYIDEKYFEELYSTAKKYDSDIVNTNHVLYYDFLNKNIKKSIFHIYDETELKGKFDWDNSITIDSMGKLLILKYNLNRNVCFKLWKREFLIKNDIKFVMDFLGEDFCFVLISLIYNPKISHNDNAIYYYVQYPRETNWINTDYLKSYILIAKHSIEYSKKNNNQYLNNIFNLSMYFIYETIILIYKSNVNTSYALKMLLDFLDELDFENIDNIDKMFKSFFIKLKKYRNDKIIYSRISFYKFIVKILPPFILKYLRSRKMIL